jgi:predicted RNA-binding protein YlxR (DUF448 family)
MKGRTQLRRTPNEELGGSEPHVPERKCVLSGAHAPRDALIRLALGPEDSVAPDVRARAPGRGAWIAVDRAVLEEAQRKGKLKSALTRAFKVRAVTIPDDIGAQIEAALRQATLDRLGLEARAGTLLTGSERIESAARAGEVALLLHAADAGADGRGRLDQAWRVGGGEGQGVVFPAERTILSLALGRQNVVHIALVDRAAAARVKSVLDRWLAFSGANVRLNAASADSPRA